MTPVEQRRWEYMADYHIEWAAYHSSRGNTEMQRFHVEMGLFAMARLLRVA